MFVLHFPFRIAKRPNGYGTIRFYNDSTYDISALSPLSPRVIETSVFGRNQTNYSLSALSTCQTHLRLYLASSGNKTIMNSILSKSNKIQYELATDNNVTRYMYAGCTKRLTVIDRGEGEGEGGLIIIPFLISIYIAKK